MTIENHNNTTLIILTKCISCQNTRQNMNVVHLILRSFFFFFTPALCYGSGKSSRLRGCVSRYRPWRWSQSFPKLYRNKINKKAKREKRHPPTRNSTVRRGRSDCGLVEAVSVSGRGNAFVRSRKS